MSTITTPAGRAVTAQEARTGAAADTSGHGADGADVADGATNEAAHASAGPRGVGVARLTPRLVWVLVVLALVASIALAATRGRDWYAARQTEQAHAAAVAAAKQLAVNFVSVDYTKVDADTARVRAGATGQFLQSYSTSVEELKKVLVANKTVSTVQRTEAALVSGDQDSAVALVGVVAPTKNTAVPAGETKTYRMRLELRRVGEAWKVENLEFVG
jgi:Mce-associated membrane protein